MAIGTKFRTLLAGVGALFSGGGAHAEGRVRKVQWSVPSLPGKIDPFTRDNLLIASPSGLATPQISGVRETARSSTQKVDRAEIRGTWVQSVFNADGSPIYQVGEVIEEVPGDLGARVRSLLSRGFPVPSPHREKSYIHPPRLEVVPLPDGRFAMEWVVVSFNSDETAVREERFDEAGRLLGSRDVAHHMGDALARVFPQGPRLSGLSEVTLESLDDSGELRSSRLETRSALDMQAESPDRRFEYPPDDPRFDQVQAHYYAERILKWFSDRFQLETGRRLALKVQVGTKSNSAFYYANLVRLGTGDGIKYRDMARDPSIVMHEVVHAVIDSSSRLPPDGEGGGLNEAFADFFTASFLENPNMGEVASVSAPFTRTLKNSMLASEGLKGSTYTAAKFIGGTFWDLRELLGKETVEELAFRTLLRLGAGSHYADFVPTLSSVSESRNALDRDQIKRVLEGRGWPMDGWKDLPAL